MGKQKTGKSSSDSGSAQKWAQPIAKEAAGSVQSVFNENQPHLQGITNTVNQSLFNPMVDRFGASSGQAGQGRDYYGDVLGGKYLGGNPHLESVIGGARRGISDTTNSNFATSGRYGSGAHTDVLSRNLGEMESQMRWNDYNAERSRMDGAAAGAIGANNADGAQALAASGVAAELPYAGTNSMANALGALFNGGNNKSTQYGPNPIWGALGAGMGAAGAYFGGKASDRRLKHKIVEIGTLPNGLTVFDFVYKRDPDQATYRGVMADEVKTKLPEAHIENFNGTGFDGVNYSLVGMPMLKLAA